jgi:hypothetical protein
MDRSPFTMSARSPGALPGQGMRLLLSPEASCGPVMSLLAWEGSREVQ